MSEGFYQLFKSHLRGTIREEQHTGFVTFNEGNYFHESRNPVGILAQFSEHYFNGTKQLELSGQTDPMLLFPIEGELSIGSEQESQQIGPQELYITKPGQSFRVSNAFPDEITRFYILQLKSPGLESGIHSYALEERNKLISCYESTSCSLSIGVFDGRQDERFQTSRQHVFVTVINGAFEVQNRLMETNDSLLAINDPNLEFEALSENAVILFFSF